MVIFDKEFGQDFDGELSPEAAHIARSFDNPSAPPIEQMDIGAARREHALEAYDIEIAYAELDIENRTIQAAGREIGLRLYSPKGSGSFPILVFAHGGCWTFCSLDSHDRLCRYYAHHANCVVVAVDYALAPEHPYPQGLNDLHDAVIWCFEHAAEIHGDASRIAVAGDSAGGNLSAAVAQRMQNHPQFRLTLQLLIYPICDASQLHGGSLDRYQSGYFFTREVLAWTATLYTSGGYPATHPEISPLHGSITPKLAPAMFIIAECDVLRDQAVAYSQVLRDAGVKVDCHYYRGVPHAFVAMAGTLKIGQEALQDSAKRLRLAFASDDT